MTARAASGPGMRRWVIAFALIAVLALLPSKACACLETYRLSPVRVLISAQLALVLAVLALASPGARAVWGFGAGLVAVVSAALALAIAAHSLVAALIVLFVPLLGAVVLVARHRLRSGAGGACGF